MGIKISETAMAGENSSATAKITDDGKWEVSWLPKPVDRNSAITAMVLSESLAAKPEAGSDRWVFIDGWSEELSLTRNQVLALFSRVQEHGQNPGDEHAEHAGSGAPRSGSGG